MLWSSVLQPRAMLRAPWLARPVGPRYFHSVLSSALTHLRRHIWQGSAGAPLRPLGTPLWCPRAGLRLMVLGSMRTLASQEAKSPAAASPGTSLKSAAKSEHAPKPAVTKPMLLQQAASPLARLWVHVRWPLTRNDRPFSIDDFSAFASWVVMGQVLWVILGTTTFVLVAMYLIHTLDQFWTTIHGDARGVPAGTADVSRDASFLGRVAGGVLSHGLGAHLVFEKGHVLPRLEDGMLKFRNVTILRAPSSLPASVDFSAKIAALNVSLSFKKWYEGKGLIYDLEIFGMHATVARDDEALARGIHESPSPTFSSLALSFSGYQDSHELQNDFSEHKIQELTKITSPAFALLDPNYELASVKVRDSSVEIHEQRGASPLRVSIFNCDLPRLRGDRLLIDFFNAGIVTGTVNNSMFTIHKHQTLLNSGNTVTFKLDGIDMGSLSLANPSLKFNWLVSGKAEIVADIRLPALEDAGADSEKRTAATSGAIRRFLQELGELTNPQAAASGTAAGEGSLLKGALMAIYEKFAIRAENKHPTRESDYVIVNAKVKFTDLKATLPPHLPMASSQAVPFTSLQNLRSLISYINGLENEEPLVIRTTVIEKLTDLYHVDNISQTKIYDAIIGDIYEELTRMVESEEKRIMREKSSMWSHSVMSQVLLLGLGVLA